MVGVRVRPSANGDRAPLAPSHDPSPPPRIPDRAPRPVSRALWTALLLGGIAAGVLTHLALFRRAKHQLGF